MEAGVTRVMPWMRALPERVAFASLSTELGDVNICLKVWRSLPQHACWKRSYDSLSRECRCATSPSTDSHHHTYSRSIKKLAIDLRQRWTLPIVASAWLWKRICNSARAKNKPYSGLYQSTPAGQRRNPVFSWLYPRSIFMFRAIGGTRGSPRGMSQSIIADFKLLVSSDLALEAPFCNYRRC